MNWDSIGLLIAAGLVGFSTSFLLYGIIRDRLDPHGYFQMIGTLRRMGRELARSEMRVLDLESLLDECEHGHQRNIAFIRSRGFSPPYIPDTEEIRRRRSSDGVLPALYEIFYERFSDEELEELIFQAGFQADALIGQTHSSRARNLLRFAQRRNLIGKLVETGKNLRPDIEWPEPVNGDTQGT